MINNRAGGTGVEGILSNFTSEWIESDVYCWLRIGLLFGVGTKGLDA